MERLNSIVCNLKIQNLNKFVYLKKKSSVYFYILCNIDISCATRKNAENYFKRIFLGLIRCPNFHPISHISNTILSLGTDDEKYTNTLSCLSFKRKHLQFNFHSPVCFDNRIINSALRDRRDKLRLRRTD